MDRSRELDEPVPEGVWRKVMYPDAKTLEESRLWWSKRFGRELTLEETAEIHHNLFGLVKLLCEEEARQQRERGRSEEP